MNKTLTKSNYMIEQDIIPHSNLENHLQLNEMKSTFRCSFCAFRVYSKFSPWEDLDNPKS